MPKKPIDYSNTIIYKLCCNDHTVTDVYVGHTTDFTQRKYRHKICCNNPSKAKYHLKVYEFIRNHGGWDNWSMVEIERLECIDENDAKKNERKHLELLGATLNCNVPGRSQKEYCLEHTEEINKYQRQYRVDHLEELKEKKRQYRLEHLEEINEKNRQYRLEHAEEINERRRQTYLKKKETTLSLLR